MAPLLYADSRDAIPEQYIVVFHRPPIGERVAAARDRALDAQIVLAEALAQRLGGTIRHRYRSAIKGFSARLTPEALQAVRSFPGVAWVEANQRGSLETVQPNPPIGLDRTSERLLPLDSRYTHSGNGAGVHVYVIDTGINPNNFLEFGGRVQNGFSAVGGAWADCTLSGHGTHVAGTIGSRTYGIAKGVTLHSIRVFHCDATGSSDDAIYGIDWMSLQPLRPAVANLSARYAASQALDNAVTWAVLQKGYVFVVAAGNQTTDACNFSPARLPAAITVAAVDLTPDPVSGLRSDTRASFSNYGSCVDLFAPGVDILSTTNTTSLSTGLKSGTSMAAPHVAGVAALYLENNPTAPPATVWGAIFHAANIFGGPNATPNWPGIVNPGPNSPNTLLHWGSGSSDGYMDGDPHLMTVDGVRYDLQGAGEYVYLREAGGLEIQIRHTPLATATRGAPDPYDGLSTCVSLNTAVAARVGSHRVTFQQDLGGPPTSNPNSLEMRVDGVPTQLTPQGINLGGGLVRRSSANGMEIHFADGAVLLVTPGWFASHNLWWLSVDLLHTTATQGLLGAIAPGSWLPRLPNGTSVGPMPPSLAQRYAVLYQQFAESWRVSNATSLFDYRSGMSTATFANRNWPTLSGQCRVPRSTTPPSRPALPLVAQQACLGVEDRHRRGACMFDVQVTGETDFARTYLLSQGIRARLVNVFRGDESTETEDPDDLPD